jgi:hypothetical protein
MDADTTGSTDNNDVVTGLQISPLGGLIGGGDCIGHDSQLSQFEVSTVLYLT